MELSTYNLGELSPVDIREYLQEKDAPVRPSSINPFRSTAEKGERTYERYAEHLAAALGEFEKLHVEVHTREWRAIV